MYRHITVTFVLGTLVGCSSSSERPPKEPGALEECVGSMSTAQDAIESPGIPTNAILSSGDIACFAFDSAHNLQVVPQAAAGTPHISAHMTAEPDMTMLMVKNETSSTLAYRALLRLPGAGEWQETSIVPVMAGLFGAETWPHPIDAIALFEFRLDPAQ
jgi:hypothetical protein